MSTADPFASWSVDQCAAWLAAQEDAEAAAVTDDDLFGLFDAELLVSAFGEATLGMAKAWTESKHKRDAGGKFSTVAGAAVALATGTPVQSHTVKSKPTIGDKHAAAHGITGAHRIVVQSKRVTKYAGHDSVESYVGTHKRGRAHALRTLAADHKAGRIEFEAPAAAAHKPAPTIQPLTDGQTLTGDHVITSGSANSVFEYAGVKAGDTLDEAAAKIAAKGHGPGVTAAAFGQAHKAGKIAAPGGGKAVAKPLAAVALVGKPIAPAPAAPKPKRAGKLTDGHTIADPSLSAAVKASDVEVGDTVAAAKAKMKAAGFGKEFVAKEIDKLHAAGGTTAPPKPAKPSAAETSAAVKAAKPAAGWKDDPARWAKAPAAPLSTERFEFLVPDHQKLASKAYADLAEVRAALGVSYTGNKGAAAANRAVKDYTGSGNGPINKALRDGLPVPGALKDTAAELDTLTAAQRTKADAVLYRGIQTTGGKTWDGKPNLNNMPPPRSFDDAGFCSLSLNPGISKGFGGMTAEGNRAVFRVRVPKGSKLANIGRQATSDDGLVDEAECLLPRGSKFVYVGHQMIDGLKVIDVEHVPN